MKQFRPWVIEFESILARSALGLLLAGIISAVPSACAQDVYWPVAPAVQASSSGLPGNRKGPASAQEGSKVGVALKLSSLGVGAEVAGEVTRHLNVRGGVNGFGYSRDFDHHGVHYAGDLRWLSGEAHLDYFPFAGGFHLSPGLLAYNGNQITGTASAAGGSSLTLNGTSYISDPANPITGTARLDFRKVAPSFLIGFGNLVPRRGKHFSFNVEAGAAYTGLPRVNLALSGAACDTTGVNCRAISSDATIQSNVLGEQNKISHNVSLLRFYPLLSLNLGYRF